MHRLSAKERVERYLSPAKKPVTLKRLIGDGTDGIVWETSRRTAVKVPMREAAYANERDTYLRLAEWGLTQQIDGFWVPKMLGCDDEH